MGDKKTEETQSIVEDMKSSLGIEDDTQEELEDKKPQEDKPKEEETSKKEDDTSKKEKETPNPIAIEQALVQKEIVKLDLQIEQLQEKSVDMDSFYSNIEEHLSEDEQALEFDNKSAYMKLINTKAKEFEEKNSNTTAINELAEKKAELEKVYERQDAILRVSKKYPDYNHEKVLNFYENKISKEEQDKIISQSSSYEDVYENTYNLFVQANPTNIKKTPAPNIPNLNNSRREQANNNDVSDGFTSADEKLREALGF